MKKRISRLLITVMLTQILLGVLAPVAYARSQKIKRWGDWLYREKSDGIALVACYAKTETVRAPRFIRGKKVTEIISDDFRLTMLLPFFKSEKTKRFIIPDTVKTVDVDALAYNSLDSIKIGKGVQRLRHMFNDEIVGGTAFPPLKKIVVDPKNKVYRSRDGVLYNKEMTVLYKFPYRKKQKTFTVPQTVRKISADAFFKAKYLKHIILPSGLKIIGFRAFSEVKGIKTVQLPNSLTYLGTYAFYGCRSLSAVSPSTGIRRFGEEVFADTPFEKKLYRHTGTGQPVYWGNVLFACKGQVGERLEVQAGTRIIGDEALSEQKNLKELIVPDSVICIGLWAVSDCPKLTNIQLGNRIQIIDARSFVNTPFWNTYLKSQKVGVLYYQGIAMGGKSGTRKETLSLKKIKIRSGTSVIADGAFSFDFPKLKKLTIPKSVIHIGAEAFENTDIRFTVYKNSYAHRYLKKHGFRNLKVIPA